MFQQLRNQLKGCPLTGGSTVFGNLYYSVEFVVYSFSLGRWPLSQIV